MTDAPHLMLVARLKAVGLPAYPVVQPPNTAYPACVYARGAYPVERALEGDAEVITTYHLDFRASTYAELEEVVKRATNALTSEGVSLYPTTDLYDDELGLYRRLMDAAIS